MSAAAHLHAVCERLRDEGLTVYGDATADDDGSVPRGAVYPYALVTWSAPLVSSDVMCDDPTLDAYDFSVTCVGSSVIQCLWVVDRARVLAGFRPAVDGRVCETTAVYTNPARRDTDVPDRVVFTADLGYTLNSYAA